MPLICNTLSTFNDVVPRVRIGLDADDTWLLMTFEHDPDDDAIDDDDDDDDDDDAENSC